MKAQHRQENNVQSIDRRAFTPAEQTLTANSNYVAWEDTTTTHTTFDAKTEGFSEKINDLTVLWAEFIYSKKKRISSTSTNFESLK